MYEIFSFGFLWLVFFFFKHKTAYEMRISDWSSDVCSSDLYTHTFDFGTLMAGNDTVFQQALSVNFLGASALVWAMALIFIGGAGKSADRKSGVEGKSVSVRVDLGGRRIIKKKKLLVV